MPSNIVTQRYIECLQHIIDNKIVRSYRQFAQSIDYLPQSLSEVLKGNRDVTIEVIRKSVMDYRFNPVYLFTGEGNKIMDRQQNNHQQVFTVIDQHSNQEQILHVAYSDRTQYIKGPNTPATVRDLPKYTLPGPKYEKGIFRSFDWRGDRMEPKLYDGDTVIGRNIDPKNWESEILDNQVYIIVTSTSILINRVQNKIKTNGELILRSDNDYYPTEALPIADVQEVWQVVTKMSPFVSQTVKNTEQTIKDELVALRQIILNLQDQIHRFPTSNDPNASES